MNYASAFCHTIIDTLAGMPDKGSALLNFLALTRYTAVFEILNHAHQHIVNLSYLKDEPLRSELKFITFSHVPADFDSTVTNLCALPPDYGIEIARCLHLSTAHYELIENQPATLNEYLLSVKYRHNCEGEVRCSTRTRTPVLSRQCALLLEQPRSSDRLAEEEDDLVRSSSSDERKGSADAIRLGEGSQDEPPRNHYQDTKSAARDTEMAGILRCHSQPMGNTRRTILDLAHGRSEAEERHARGHCRQLSGALVEIPRRE